MSQPRPKHARSFIRAVLTGTLVGAAPMLLLTVPLGIILLFDPLPTATSGSLSNVPGSLWLAILPLVVAFPLVLSSSVLLGVPTFLILRKMGRESFEAYTTIGGLFGFAVPIMLLWLSRGDGGYWTCALGAVGGAATAWSWARARSRMMERRPA